MAFKGLEVCLNAVVWWFGGLMVRSSGCESVELKRGQNAGTDALKRKHRSALMFNHVVMMNAVMCEHQ